MGIVFRIQIPSSPPLRPPTLKILTQPVWEMGI